MGSEGLVGLKGPQGRPVSIFLAYSPNRTNTYVFLTIFVCFVKGIKGRRGPRGPRGDSGDLVIKIID